MQGATGPVHQGRAPWPRSEQGRAADVERVLLDHGGGDADLVRGKHGGRPDDRATLRGTQPGRELSVDVCRLEAGLGQRVVESVQGVGQRLPLVLARSEEDTAELQPLLRRSYAAV